MPEVDLRCAALLYLERRTGLHGEASLRRRSLHGPRFDRRGLPEPSPVSHRRSVQRLRMLLPNWARQRRWRLQATLQRGDRNRSQRTVLQEGSSRRSLWDGRAVPAFVELRHRYSTLRLPTWNGRRRRPLRQKTQPTDEHLPNSRTGKSSCFFFTTHDYFKTPYVEPRTTNVRFCDPTKPSCPRGRTIVVRENLERKKEQKNYQEINENNEGIDKYFSLNDDFQDILANSRRRLNKTSVVDEESAVLTAIVRFGRLVERRPVRCHLRDQPPLSKFSVKTNKGGNTLSRLKPTDSEEAATGDGKSNVCEKGNAYLVNGSPKQCTTSPCPTGYKCTFSKKTKNYYCCSVTVASDGESRSPLKCNSNLFFCRLSFRIGSSLPIHRNSCTVLERR